VSGIEALGFLKAMFNGDKTYDNRTEENTMKAENYLYEIEPQGRKAQVKLSGRGPGRLYGLGRLSAWRRGRRGCEQGTGAHTNGVQIGNEHRVREMTAEQSKKH